MSKYGCYGNRNSQNMAFTDESFDNSKSIQVNLMKFGLWIDVNIYGDYACLFVSFSGILWFIDFGHLLIFLLYGNVKTACYTS